jgi:type II secretory pathway component GspD/PulD (secretin)
VLEGAGIPFPRGSNAIYLPTLNRLVVTNWAKNFEVVEKVLEELNVGQYQLSIESRVLRLPKKMARDVFKEQLDARGAVAISDETVRTLDRLDAEMKLFTVCRPRVTTVFGQKATTKSTRQILYVTHYKLEDGKPMPQLGNCEVGTEMTVKPVLGADGHTINLSLELKISSFIEMRKTNAMLPGFDKPVPMETPELTVRNVSTNLTLQRDSTVMLPLLDDAPEPNVKKDFVEIVLINASINWPRLAKPQKAP